MQIDQEWVVENIDLMMKEFLTVHPQFKKNDNTSMAGRSQHKKAMMGNCDTLTYRPIYYIAKTVPETRNHLENKVKRFWNDREDYKRAALVWKSNYDYVKKMIIEEFGKKSYEYEVCYGLGPKSSS